MLIIASATLAQEKLSSDIILLHVKGENAKQVMNDNKDVQDYFMFLKINERDTTVVEDKGYVYEIKGEVYMNKSDKKIGDFDIKNISLIYNPEYLEMQLTIKGKLYSIHYGGYQQILDSRMLYIELSDELDRGSDLNKGTGDSFVVKRGKILSSIDKM